MIKLTPQFQKKNHHRVYNNNLMQSEPKEKKMKVSERRNEKTENETETPLDFRKKLITWYLKKGKVS